MKIKFTFVWALFCILNLVSICAIAQLNRDIKKNDTNSRLIQMMNLLRTQWVHSGGLEIITAGPGLNQNESRWGHLAIRFVGSGSNDMDDLILETAAKVDSSDSSFKIMYKGLAGEYPIVISFDSLGVLILKYYFQETRGFSRLIMPTTQTLRLNFIANIQKLLELPELDNKYSFLGNNCATFATRLLENSGFKVLPMPWPMIPTLAIQFFRRSFLTPFPEIHATNILEFESLKGSKLLNNVKSISTIELQKTLAFSLRKDFSDNEIIAAELQTRQDLSTTEEIYGIGKLASHFYQRDSGENLSANQIWKAFGSSRRNEEVLKNRAYLNTNYTSSFCKNAIEQCEYFQNVLKNMEQTAP